MSKHAPGPGTYAINGFFNGNMEGGKINPVSVIEDKKKMNKNSIYKCKEELVLNSHIQALNNKPKQANATMGTAPRNYDPMFYAAGKEEFVAKGLQ
jgi:hypothetical protein